MAVHGSALRVLVAMKAKKWGGNCEGVEKPIDTRGEPMGCCEGFIMPVVGRSLPPFWILEGRRYPL